jgi:hypothetical protein
MRGVRQRDCCDSQTNTYHVKGCQEHVQWLRDHGVAYAPLCGEDLDEMFASPLPEFNWWEEHGETELAVDATFENEFKVHRQESGQ